MNETKFKIEKNKPMPAPRDYRKYPFTDMEVGDSFLFTGDRRLVASAAASFASRNKRYKFSVREDVGGFRVWRIKP